jgi:hypothetical protein
VPTPFEWCVQLNLVAIGNLLRWHLKHHVALYTVSWHVLTSMTRKSSSNNSLIFSLSSTSKGVLDLQSCKVILIHLIVSNLFIFLNFINLYFFYIFFLSNLILILLIHIYFVILFLLDFIFQFNL